MKNLRDIIAICFFFFLSGFVMTCVMCGITSITNADRKAILDTIPYDKLPDSKRFEEHNGSLTKWSCVFNILLCTVLFTHTALFCFNFHLVKSLTGKE